MPTYTYRCKNCGNEFDQYQKFTDNPLTRCPKCGKNMLRRVLQPSAIVFKGSGWYATDNRSASGASAKAEKADKADQTKAEAGEKSDGDKSEKAVKGDKPEKPEKAIKAEPKAAKKDTAAASDA